MRLVTLLLLVAAQLSAQTPPANPGFEEGKPGEAPPGWIVPNPNDYPGEISNTGCESGKQCLLLASRSALATINSGGTVFQVFDATPYRGRKVRFRAAVRTEVAGPLSHAQLWLRVQRQTGAAGFNDDMSDRAISTAQWQTYEITGDIDRDAAGITIGLILSGVGKAWMDSASFAVIGDADPVEPPRPLSPRAIDNLEALARLFGYVRFFHPSDQAASADWAALLFGAVRQVENAASPQDLCARLHSVFAAVAPTVQIFPTGSAPAPLPLEPKAYVTYWQHHGIGFRPRTGGDEYHSERITVPAAQAAGALKPFRADLPGGISVLVPTALYRETPEAPAPSNFLMRPAGSADDRTTRLVAVMAAWNVLQHFYPYFDVVSTDWPAALRTALTSAAQDADAGAFEKTLKLMIAALHDGHGSVIRSGGYVPLFNPPVLWTWAEGRIVALRVNGVPQIHPGDALVTIDGVPAAEALAAQDKLVSGATPQWIRYVALQSFPGGSRGSEVRLEMEAFAQPGSRYSITVPRDTPQGALYTEARPDKIKQLEPGVYYLDLDRISDADFNAALPSLANAKAILFDLRGYPRNIRNPRLFFSHLIDKHATSAQFLTPVCSRPDRRDMTFERTGEWQMDPVAPLLKAKLVFLTDARAISTAESYLGIVEAYQLGEIAGEATAGTNGGINPFVVPGGYSITWTGLKVLKHDGSQHHGVGIHPTVPVSPTRAGIAAGRDEVLERALQLVRK